MEERVWLKLIGKRRFWYRVRLVYKDKKNNGLFDYSCDIGLTHKSKILDSRLVKQTIGFNKIRPIYKHIRHLLTNGNLEVSDVSYLGFLRNPNK